MKILRSAATSLVLLAGFGAAMIAAPTASLAQGAAPCSMAEAQYCVKGKDGSMHTAWTNACFAKKDGVKIVSKGACKSTGMAGPAMGGKAMSHGKARGHMKAKGHAKAKGHTKRHGKAKSMSKGKTDSSNKGSGASAAPASTSGTSVNKGK